MIRRLIFAFIVWTYAGCSAPGLPASALVDDGGTDCGKLDTPCCGQDGGNSTLWTCDPGLYCRVHRGGPEALCAVAQDGGTL